MGEPGLLRLRPWPSLFLDGLRWGAAEVVLIGHALSFLSPGNAFEPPHQPYMQNIAVGVFFLLSGFLITLTLLLGLRDPSYDFRGFVIDRAARIYSGLVPALLFVAIVDAAWVFGSELAYPHPTAFGPGTFALNLGMLQDHPVLRMLFPGRDRLTSFGSARPLWTLAVEWWLYLWFGYVFLRFARARKLATWFDAAVFAGVLAVLSIVPGWHLIGGRGEGIAWVWISGAVVAHLHARQVFQSSGIRAPGIAALLSLGLLVLRWRHIRTTNEGFDLILFLLAALVLWCAITALQQLESEPPQRLVQAVRLLAGFSFMLYLVHYTICELLSIWNAARPRPHSVAAMFALSFVTSNLIALALAFPTEMRHKRLAAWLRARWLPPRWTAPGSQRRVA